MIFMFIMIPIAMLFTGMGIYSMRKKTPMHFYSGTTVEASEITDVRAYNRANGIMWIAYSLLYWLSAFLGLYSERLGGFFLIGGCVFGTVGLLFAYNWIYSRYKR